MNTNEELETTNKKLSELTNEELQQVAGGQKNLLGECDFKVGEWVTGNIHQTQSRVFKCGWTPRSPFKVIGAYIIYLGLPVRIYFFDIDGNYCDFIDDYVELSTAKKANAPDWIAKVPQ